MAPFIVPVTIWNKNDVDVDFLNDAELDADIYDAVNVCI